MGAYLPEALARDADGDERTIKDSGIDFWEFEMQKSTWSLATFLTIASCLVPAQAEILAYDLRGTVGELTDDAGVFGSPLPGAVFKLTYFGDFDLGAHSGGGGAHGSTNHLVGGTTWPENMAPGIQISPVSAVLEINGHALNFSGEYDGRVEYTTNTYDVQFGGYGASWAELSAEAHDSQDRLLSFIGSRLDSPYSAGAFGSVASPQSHVVDGNLITGSTFFKYLWAADTPNEKTISGRLNPTTYAVTAVVPEPATWLLLLLGLAGISVFGIARRNPDREDSLGTSSLC